MILFRIPMIYLYRKKINHAEKIYINQHIAIEALK